MKNPIYKLGCYCGSTGLTKANVEISYGKRKELIEEKKAFEILHPCSNCGDNFLVILP